MQYYSISNAKKKRKALRSKKHKTAYNLYFTITRLAITVGIGAAVIAFSAGLGLLFGILDSTPSLQKEDIKPTTFMTTLYDADHKKMGHLIGSNANRISVSLDKMPTNLKNAFIAIEDERFYSHNGIDPTGIMRASTSTLLSGHVGQGASTITQQLLKNVIFAGGNEASLSSKIQRKIQEQYLALELETKVSKDEILENYLNTINLGQNTLGVQAAAERYFDKPVSKLSLSECAVLASITKNPSGLNPILHPRENKYRRDAVLSNMLEQHMISKADYKKALKEPVYEEIEKVNIKKNKSAQTVTSYFTDALITQVMEDLQEKLGYTEEEASNLIYRGGLKIYTTQDTKLQKICNSVINNQQYYPFSTSYSLTYRLSVQKKDGTMVNYDENSILSYFKKRSPGFELTFSNEKTGKKWIKEFKNACTPKKGTTVVGEQITFSLQPQLSFVLMEPSTGKVKALVGGRGQKTANRTLNRATDSKRQPGSTFKVLSAYLPALDAKNMTLATTFEDAPYTYPGTNKQVKNWNGSYRGLTTIRDAITNSMNVVTVKTMAEVTPDVALKYLKNLEFTTLVTDSSLSHNDRNLALALGGLTYGVTNYEITAAYSAIANNGKYQTPILYTKICDHNGKVLLKNKSKSKQVMKASTAFLLTDAMKDVVTRGTGTAANFSVNSIPVAGKTGTTTSSVDAWFVGYTPYYCAGIWTGYDTNQSLSNATFHKTIWKTIMEKIHADLPSKNFTKPSSIVSAKICSKSGLLANPATCPYAKDGSTVRIEYFAGSAPTSMCQLHRSSYTSEATPAASPAATTKPKPATTTTTTDTNE